ncbi:MAG: copper homeostasis protein CutC [Bacteroidales bacterium]
MDLEVCAYSLESCIAARKAGATRVELCAAPLEGGTTPSACAIAGAVEILKGENENPVLQLYVMIRPRGGDFYYTALEYEQMRKEIDFVKGIPGVDGVVFGLLKPDGTIDILRTASLVERAKDAGLGVTFHRAFDMSAWSAAGAHYSVLEEVITTGADRILTSGFHATAIEGKKIIGELVKQAGGRIQIMAGSGVGVSNAQELAALGVDALHMSGKAFRESEMIYRNPLLSMGGAKSASEYSIMVTSEEAVRAVREMLPR